MLVISCWALHVGHCMLVITCWALHVGHCMLGIAIYKFTNLQIEKEEAHEAAVEVGVVVASLQEVVVVWVDLQVKLLSCFY